MRSVQEGDCPRRVPAPGLSRRHHITRPHSQNTRVLPQPAPGPDAPEARVSGTRAYPREAHAARPRSRSGPGGLRRGAVPALGSPGLSLPPRCPPPGPGRPEAPVSSPAAAGPGGTRAHAARFGFGASFSCYTPADLALPGSGSGVPERGGRPGNRGAQAPPRSFPYAAPL